MFGASSGLVFLVFFGACQCFVKSESPNLHRHQKNQKNQTTRHQKKQKKQTTRCTKPAQAPKKPKKLKFPGTMGPLLSSCWNFWFFLVFFGACRCLVHLVVWFFWFFWCLSMFCEVRVTKPAQAPKNTKKQTTRCTKHLHRHQKNKKKLKFPGTMGPLLSSCWNFCFFCFFWCLSMFGASSGLFFCFFGACQCFVKSESPNLHRHQKNQKNQTTRCTKPAQAPKKPKKLKFPGTMGPLLSSCWNCFGFFWCLSMFGASSGLVFLVPVNVLWSQSHQTCTGTKKNKKNKPLDAPNLHRHQKNQKN